MAGLISSLEWKGVVLASVQLAKMAKPSNLTIGRNLNYTLTKLISLWSHDDYQEQAGGYLAPASSSSKYADQNFVYNELGAPLLENALEGFNCAIFAYGQTGSGKSYSIFGNESNKGIIPMVREFLATEFSVF